MLREIELVLYGGPDDGMVLSVVPDQLTVRIRVPHPLPISTVDWTEEGLSAASEPSMAVADYKLTRALSGDKIVYAWEGWE